MKLKEATENYIRYKENLGTDFEFTGNQLRKFGQALGDVDVQDISREATKAFIFGKGPITPSLHFRYRTVRGLVRYMIARNYIDTSPLPPDIPKRPPEFVPHIYTKDELGRILHAAKTQSGPYKITGSTLYTLILLLYACGLRLGEGVRLTLGDVNLDENILTIRDTKFHKTRFVPFSPDVNRVLRSYIKHRSEQRHPGSAEAFFFLTKQSLPIAIRLAGYNFRRLLATAGVRRKRPHPRYGPRLHDLRHTFAVHRLTACYQEGGDPQRLLPALSTYLGHVDIAATVRYLTITPELRRHASKRFEEYAFPGGSHD
jgi:integrase/recombinase XerD